MSDGRRSRPCLLPRCVLQARDRKLLAELYTQRVLTRDQLIGLGYFRTVVRCNARMRKLASQGYAAKLQFSARGSGSQTVWCLGKHGVPIVAAQLDMSVAQAGRIAIKPVAAAVLEHTLLLTDVRVAFEKLALRARADAFRWISEIHCRHEFVARGRYWTIKPDGFVEWNAGTRARLFIELDLGNVSSDEFGAKCESYVEYATSGAFGDVYGEGDFAVFVVTTGPRRLEHLARVSLHVGLTNVRFLTWDELQRVDSLQFLCGSLMGREGGAVQR